MTATRATGPSALHQPFPNRVARTNAPDTT